MPSKQKIGGLGKGIEGLMGTTLNEDNEMSGAKPASGGPTMIKITELTLNPDQPRKDFNLQQIVTLADSIRLKGIIEPLIVRKKERGYELIAGHRRLMAADKAGLKEVPAIVRDIGDSPQERLELALIENLLRSDLNPVEEAESFQRLVEEFDKKDDDIGKMFGKDRTTIINSRRLLELPEKILDDVRKRLITSSHASAILSIKDKSQWEEAWNKIVTRKLSTREANALAKKINRNSLKEAGGDGADEGDGGDGAPDDSRSTTYYEGLERRFADSLGGLKVRIHYKGSIKKIEIQYSNNDEIEALMEKLGVAPE
jgi:ParB family chromosome partitioning protein